MNKFDIYKQLWEKYQKKYNTSFDWNFQIKWWNSIDKHNDDVLKQRWDKTDFERCHIIADKFGGSCSPKNLLLMVMFFFGC